MTDHEAAIEQFLDDADAALSEYDQGYADADATLTLVRDHIDELRETLD
ncbi:hypothetical protein [Halapricum sp. CBA1109]|jgi:predicted transcriptional regulator|nr:hypothetical protein [Halapricum sp. CBA1109]